MINRARPKTKTGFTLIELLVVIAIIAILVAVAIPQFTAYRKMGFASQVESDLKNAAIAEESYFSATNVYKACNPCTGADLPDYGGTPGVTIEATASGETFALTATHSSCGSGLWYYQSTTGKITEATPCG